MPEVFTRLQRQLAEYWKKLEKSQKIRIYITSVIVVISIAAGIFMMTRPNHVVLVRNADPKEIKEMQTILDKSGIWNDVRNGNLIVNAKDSDRAHFELGAAGYPKGGMTFADAFQLIGFNTTNDDKKQIWSQYQKASLEAQLEMFEDVEDAKVELAIPEKSFFLTRDGEEQKPSAAVTIVPRGGSIKPSQVEGIVMIVSRSVVGLDPENIVVVDNHGNVYNNKAVDQVAEATNTQFEMQLKVKNMLEKNVRDMFSGQFDSFDAIRVVANPVLDFNKQKSQIQDVTNGTGLDGGALISQHTIKEELTNGTMDSAGAPGLDSNPGDINSPSYQIATGENGNYKMTETMQNFDYKRIFTEEEKALGVMDAEKSSMTVTLLYGNRVQDDSLITEELMNQIKMDVSRATGIPVQNISVSKYKQAAPQVYQPTLSDKVRNLVETYGFLALMVLLTIALMATVLIRRKQAEEPALELAAAGMEAVPTGVELATEETSETLPEIDLEEKSEVKKQIEKLVKQKPEAVAQLLRNWLSEDWD